ncbi:ABC transporter ATP-binding protein [Pontibacter actiniarum]|uniref:Multidrug ABC transporter ATP-binding protein n=1 Tax=Pontibacter actiniarum TaxID=323450 RepID=A0A1X9YUE1_9BACT|nr:ABC transporter ATP-binding protein [Pontibacter actiniarum]ARS36507.1 multidrug ABC transporter ATP-binding protein [Pontibacter actiniarum]
MELVIQNLSKTYPNGTKALKNINLTIPKGMFGLLGPNGAGKSSLMRTIATLQEADTGSIMLGDLDVLREKETMRKVLGYLPQEFGVYPKVSAEELLDHFAILKGVSNSKERKEVVKALLQQTNLYDVRKKNLGGYSGGMKQRFGIAQALLGNPKIIIVDEPTAGLDPAERNRFHNLLSEIGENIIVILSTHIVEDVTDLCRNFAIINKGEVLLEGDPLNVIDSLRGRIWRKFINKDELVAHQLQHEVISSRLFAGKTIIHVLAEVQPAPEFEAVAPDLEDVYFSKIHEAARREQAAPANAIMN